MKRLFSILPFVLVLTASAQEAGDVFQKYEARVSKAVDRGFAVSDHADWPGLLGAIGATGAQRVIVTHGSVPVMVRHLRERGLQAESFDTEYGDDAMEADLQAGQEGTA